MAIAPTFRRTPLKSLLDFAADREREANSIGNVIDQITKPILGGMGVQTEEMMPQPAVLRGPAPQAQPLGAFTGPPMAPTPVDFNPRSTELLGAADPRLREILTETERRAREQGIEIQVSETLRDSGRQAALVEQGKSQTMNSKHLTGNAADIYIQNPDGSANWDFEAYRPVAAIAKEVAAEKGYDDLVWGGDWKTLKDGVHFQLGGAAAGGGGATTLVGGAGGDTLGGGMNVEDILARLYPEESPEDARVQRRRDILAGVSQVFGALDQGGVPDVSNIRAQQEARKRQAVLDMRERERARAAASLVYSQTEDRDLAAGIATGAISYGDVVSERERRRVEAEADKARVKQEQANGRLAGMVESMAPDLGIPTDLLPQIVEGIKAGDDPDTYFTLTEQAKLAEAARETDETEAAAAEARALALETFTASQDPVEQRAGRLMTLDPSLSLDDALTRASELLKPSGADQGFEFEAKIRTRTENLGEDAATATRKVLEEAQTQGYNVINLPGGGMAVVPATPSVAAPAGVAPAGAAPAAPLGVPTAPAASAGVAGAFGQQMDTGLIGAPVAAPVAAPAPALPLGVATDVADLETKLFDLQQARDAAPDEAAKRALDLQIGEVQFQQAELALQEARSAQGLDEEEQRLRIQEAEQRVATAKAERDQKEREAAALEETEEEKAARRKYENTIAADTVVINGQDALSMFARRLEKGETGPAYGIISYGAQFIPRTESYNLSNAIQAMRDAIALDRLQAMKENSPTGASGLGQATEKEGQRLENALGVLDPVGDPVVEIPKVKRAINIYLDTIYGTPEFIQQQYEAGELTAEEAAQFSRRYDEDTLDLRLPDPAFGGVTSLQQDEDEGGMTAEERAVFDMIQQQQ